MRKLTILLALLVFCSIAQAELIPNPESFEYEDIVQIYPPSGEWESWASGSGSGGWCGGASCGGGAEIIAGDSTDGTRCLQVSVDPSLYYGYALVFNGGNPIVPGEIYEYFLDYKFIGAASTGVIKIEFFDAGSNMVDVAAWDPITTTTPDIWQHFSYTFRAPEGAETATVVVGATGPGSAMRYDMVGLLPAACPYELEGDFNNDCKVNLADFVLLAANWLIDCVDDPTNPACVTP